MFVAKDLVTGRRVNIRNAESDRVYICPDPECEEHLILKRGEVRAHHFAHKPHGSGTGRCAYLEDEKLYNDKSDWHIDWQNCFPADAQEIYFKGQGGSRCRADVYLKEAGKVIEFQHSPLPVKEFHRRNEFYKKKGICVLWLFDFTEDFNMRSIRYKKPEELSDKQRYFAKKNLSYIYSLSIYEHKFGDYDPKNDPNIKVCFYSTYMKDGEKKEIYRMINWVSDSGNQISTMKIPDKMSFISLCYQKQTFIPEENITQRNADPLLIREREETDRRKREEKAFQKTIARQLLGDAVINVIRKEAAKAADDIRSQGKLPEIADEGLVECWENRKAIIFESLDEEQKQWLIENPKQAQKEYTTKLQEKVQEYQNKWQLYNKDLNKLASKTFAGIENCVGIETCEQAAASIRATLTWERYVAAIKLVHTDDTIGINWAQCKREYSKLLETKLQQAQFNFEQRPYTCEKCGIVGDEGEFVIYTLQTHTGICRACSRSREVKMPAPPIPTIDRTPDRAMTCPMCKGKLVVRQRHIDGRMFLGCENYPECSYSRSLRI